jgi:hypothetical protein
MLIKIDYTSNETAQSSSNSYYQRYYFDNIVSNHGDDSHSGAFGMAAFYIPEEAVDISVKAHIEGRNIRDYTGYNSFYMDGWKSERDYDYMIFVNQNTYFDRAASPAANPAYDYNNTRLSPRIIKGTNVITVYFNNYGDYDWGGANHPQIYSSPFNDSNHSSYIDVNYTLSENIPFGSIELTRVKDFGGSINWDKQTSFSFPAKVSQIGDVFLHIVQQYSDMVDVWAGKNNPPSTIVFSSPASRAVPTDIYIKKNVLDISPVANNYIRVADRSRNDILPNTSVEYSFYIPSYVGYGNVFANQTAAESDALWRLNQTLGTFVSTDNIVVESSEMRDVPTLWGPAIMEVRVWH